MVAEHRDSIQRLTLAELEALGFAIGRGLRAPALVTLMGDLGAGKTTMVQAICRGLGVTEPGNLLGHLVARQLAAFAGLGSLCHLDLQFVGEGAVLRSHTEAT